MTTIAQLISEGRVTTVGEDPRNLQKMYLSYARARLCSLELPVNWETSVVGGNTTLKDVFTDEAIKRQAEIFSFTSDPSGTGPGLDVIFPIARLPSPVVWIEWPLKKGNAPIGARVGYLVERISTRSPTLLSTYVLVFLCKHDTVFPFFCGLLPELPHGDSDGFYTHLIWGCDWGYDSEEIMRDDFIQVMQELMEALFLIVTPRVCEVRDVVHTPALQRARAKARKLPLIEYRQVMLRIGVGPPRYLRNGKSDGSGVAFHKRYHHVIGFWRTYRKGREQPKAAWIEDHWRGDPALGIVVHKRSVKSS